MTARALSWSRPSTRGYALVEIVLVIGAVSVILGLCAGLLHVLLRLDRIGRAYMVETATVGRLARQVRQDVHAADRAKPGGDVDGPAPRLELVLPEDRTIAYEAREHAILRTQHHGEKVERRETYTLPFCDQPRFQLREDDGTAWVRLRLPRRADPGAGPKGLRHDLRIDALVGRDHRLSPTKETTP